MQTRLADYWLETAAEEPIAFAQVREDAQLDLCLAKSLNRELDGVMVASGGCTLATLAGSGDFARLDVVDVNSAQIELCKLKLQLLMRYDTPERLRLLGHEPMTPEDRFEELIRISDEHEIKLSNVEEMGLVGPDNCGRYEAVFAALEEELTENELRVFRLDSVQDQQIFLESEAVVAELERAFRNVMSQENLCALFGAKATANRVRPFHEHFLRQTLMILRSMPAASNPYLSQMFLGKFQRNSYYPWLSQLPPPMLPDIEFHNSGMGEFLEQSESERFDFVHLSNILDWLDESEAKTLLDQAHRVLRRDGVVVIRQLNSSLDIRKLGDQFHWNAELSSELLARDRSFFYPALHVGDKCKSRS